MNVLKIMLVFFTKMFFWGGGENETILVMFLPLCLLIPAGLGVEQILDNRQFKYQT